MKIQGSVALVTGANRGLGLAFARALLARGAAKVYAAARDPASVALPGVVPLQLDVTRPEQVAAAAEAAGDVTLLVNNAGIARLGGFLDEGAVEDLRAHFETNVVGPLAMARAFAPVLARNGGGALLDVLSVASWVTGPLLATYSASKAAAWALTNGLRSELAGQGTQVLGLHASFIDTGMVSGLEVPKSSPEAVVAEALDALERGDSQALTDDFSRKVQQGLSGQPPVYLKVIADPRKGTAG
ncbi:Short-chain dehydrogenase [Tistlia consotensis]|uniref:Short-chain dehydrogenase n=1 Tax=Tistlia consotensis USBA 355 TaxID=560819 RepID=A0A1Y6CBB3_9PROT|nr:SDR family oxidoreductase [Tistlia consotensis]SMF53263.1 Short-chain dehydrogenase [Tistlia consotensis USBA 355]SNR85318.1 Short-chain dehydrogenase [Tistlia consotensis]